MTLRNTAQVSAAARYAAASPGAKVAVEGLRAATRLSDGKSAVEKPNIGELRAEKVAEALRDIGIPATRMDVRWRDATRDAQGIEDYQNRRVDIRVTP
jgi:outer membrane protein OmpA-like peptidoglycan-associated protein